MTLTNRRRELENQEASPLTAWLHRFSAFALIFVSAAFTIWFRLDDQFLTQARSIVGDVFRPVTVAVQLPIMGVADGVSSIEAHINTAISCVRLGLKSPEFPPWKKKLSDCLHDCLRLNRLRKSHSTACLISLR